MGKRKEKVNRIALLPVELQVKIFNYLTVKEKGRCASVCQAWQNTINLPDIWRNVTYNVSRLSKVANYPELCQSIASRDIRQVYQNVTTPESVEFVRELTRRAPNLTSLHVRCTVGYEITFGPGPNCRCNYHKNVFLGYEMKLVTQSMTSLVRLVVLQSKMTDKSFKLIASCLTKLEHLELSYCNHVSDAGIGHLTGQGDVTKDPPRLKYLHIVACKKLTDKSFCYLSMGQPLLHSVHRARAKLVTDSSYKIMSVMTSVDDARLTLSNGMTLLHLRSP